MPPLPACKEWPSAFAPLQAVVQTLSIAMKAKACAIDVLNLFFITDSSLFRFAVRPNTELSTSRVLNFLVPSQPLRQLPRGGTRLDSTCRES